MPEYKWFNQELKEVFNVDVFKLPFDIDQGYFHEKYDDKEFCLIRLENLNQNFNIIMKEVFNRDSSIPLILENEAKNKFYSNDYKDLKNSLSIEELEFNKIINTSFLTKFYIDYIPTIKQKWLNK